MKKSIILLLAMVCTITACQVEEMRDVDECSSHHFCIETSFPSIETDNVETKSSIQPRITLKWSDGDLISIVNLTTGKNLLGDLVARVDDDQVYFEGDLSGSVRAGDKLAAIYPCQNYSGISNITDISFDLSNQTCSSLNEVPFCAYSIFTCETVGVVKVESPFVIPVSFNQIAISNIEPNTKIDYIELSNVGKFISFNVNKSTGTLDQTSTSGKVRITPEAKQSGADGSLFAYCALAESNASARTITVKALPNIYTAQWAQSAMSTSKYYTSIASDFTSTEYKDFMVSEPSSLEVGAEGGKLIFNVSSENKDWTVSSIPNLDITPSSGSSCENLEVVVNIPKNEGFSEKAYLITFEAADLKYTYTIKQEQNDAILADDSNTFTVPSTGGEVVINYQTNVDCEVIIPQEAQDWITIAPVTRGLVSESISLEIAENTTYDPRSAVVKIVAKDNEELVVEYTINQEQNDVILADDNNTFTVPSTGGEVVINYQTNVDCEVIIPQEAQDWITIVPVTRGLVSESISLEIAENTTNDPRSAVVKIVAKDNEELVVEYTITQEPGYFLFYTTNDGKKVDYNPRYGSAFGGVIVKSHTYEDGVGVIEFYAPITRIEGEVFMNCSNLTSVTIPDSVTSIGRLAFGGCSNLTSVTMGDRVTSMEYGVFSNCHSLTEFNTKLASEDGRCLIIEGVLYCFAPAGLTEYTIPDSVTEIYLLAFGQCKITSVTIPESVTKIGEQAFDRCKSLTSVTIGKNVTSIGMYAFYECRKLTSVYCKPTTPPVLEPNPYGYWPFDQNASDRKIYVPTQSVEAYKCAGIWKNYTSRIVGYNF